MSSTKPHTYEVIIVGAGVSGLSAARAFIQNGVENILIVEATEKVGGRIRSQYCGDSIVELGAQWIHGEENELFDLIQNSENLHDGSSWEGKGDFLTSSGDKLEQNLVTDVLDWLEAFLGHIEDNFSIETFQDHIDKWPKDISMGYYLRKEFQQYLNNYENGKDSDDLKTAVFQWAMSFQRIDNSCNQMSDLSLFRWSEYKSNGQHVYRNFKRGAQYFIDEILANSSLQSKIRLNSPVELIDWTEDITRLLIKSGEYFFCNSTLITCSAGVLKATQNELFIPKLPSALSNALNSTGFGPAAKIFLEWTEPWWSSNFLGIQLIWPNEYINCCDDYSDTKSDLNTTWYKAITGFDPVLDNPKVLLAWLGGPEAIYVEGISQSEVGTTCAKLLRQFTKNANIQEPKTVQVSSWNSNPYFRGAYSYRSKHADRIKGDITSVLIEPVYKTDKKIPVLVFAGEALHPEYYSTLHGAFASGQSQAEKLVQYLKEKG